MAIIPWKRFGDIDEFFGGDDLFSLVPMRDSKEPSMDLYETEKEVVAEMSVAGVEPDDIEISVDGGVLRIRGESRKEDEKEDKKRGYWRKEIRSGSFERAIRLPSPVKEDKVDASYESGILKVILPKQERSGDKTPIKIKKKGK